MSLLEILLLLLVAGVCGALGQAIAGVSRGGCLVAIALGFVGALVGTLVADALELPPIFTVEIDGDAFPIVWAILGSALVVAVLSLFTRGRRRDRT